MTTRMKPILGMWATLMVLSVVATLLRPEVWAGDNAMFGQWPTIAILWLITAVYFDWVVQSTGMGATQAAIVPRGWSHHRGRCPDRVDVFLAERLA